jgi:hypothetical protein
MRDIVVNGAGCRRFEGIPGRSTSLRRQRDNTQHAVDDELHTDADQQKSNHARHRVHLCRAENSIQSGGSRQTPYRNLSGKRELPTCERQTVNQA